MIVKVSRRCIGCGESEKNCPEVFSIEKQAATVHRDVVLTPELLRKVRAAALACPVGAITLDPDDARERRASFSKAWTEIASRAARLRFVHLVWFWCVCLILGFLLPVLTYFADSMLADHNRAGHFQRTWPGHHLHIATGMLWMLIGTIQFLPRLRSGRLHRWLGRIYIFAGVISVLSTVYIILLLRRETQVQPFGGITPLPVTLACLVGAYAAALRRDFVSHRAWAIRSFANGVALIMFRFWFMTPVGAWELMGPFNWLFVTLVGELVIHRKLHFKLLDWPVVRKGAIAVPAAGVALAACVYGGYLTHVVGMSEGRGFPHLRLAEIEIFEGDRPLLRLRSDGSTEVFSGSQSTNGPTLRADGTFVVGDSPIGRLDGDGSLHNMRIAHRSYVEIGEHSLKGDDVTLRYDPGTHTIEVEAGPDTGRRFRVEGATEPELERTALVLTGDFFGEFGIYARRPTADAKPSHAQ